METEYFIDANNNFIGGFSKDNPAIPQGSVKVDSAPNDARAVWTGSDWNYDSIPVANKEEKLGVTDDAKVAAMWLFLARGDSTAMDDLKLKEDQAKL